MRRTSDISIIIPAAGVGRRMKSYGPKALIDLPDSQKVITRQIELYRDAYPRAEIIVTLGFCCEQIIKHLPEGIKIVENDLYEETNVARSIGLAMRVASHNHILVSYGDLVFNREAIADLVGLKSTVLVDRRGRMAIDEVGVNITKGKVTSFEYGFRTKWAQVIYLTGLELDLFKNFVYRKTSRKWFGFEVLNKVIDGGGQLRVQEPEDMRIAEIDFPMDIIKARGILHANSL